jgi:hypothetical protein
MSTFGGFKTQDRKKCLLRVFIVILLEANAFLRGFSEWSDCGWICGLFNDALLTV